MKPCYENNCTAIYVGRALTVHNPFFNVILQLNILTGTFLLVVAPTSFKIYCDLRRVKTKNAKQNK